MSIPETTFGIQNTERFIERTLWTSGTFVVANTLASVFFSGQSFTNRAIFSLMQGGVFIYLFESKSVEDKVAGLKESFDTKAAHLAFDYAFFFFLGLAPIIVSRTITTWTFQSLSIREGLQIGFYNYLSGAVGASIYDKFLKKQPVFESRMPSELHSNPLSPYKPSALGFRRPKDREPGRLSY